jgi:hypothetical protein
VQTYEALRAMKGKGTKALASALEVGQVVRVDGMKYRVMEPTRVQPITGTALVSVYSEDNQYEILYLSAASLVPVLGTLP